MLIISKKELIIVLARIMTICGTLILLGCQNTIEEASKTNLPVVETPDIIILGQSWVALGGNTQFAANGGTSPYTWAVKAADAAEDIGTLAIINRDGLLTSLDNQGNENKTLIVTVMDKNGYSSSLSVQISSAILESMVFLESTINVNPGDMFSVTVNGTFSDTSIRDITRDVNIKVLPSGVVTIDANGNISVKSNAKLQNIKLSAMNLSGSLTIEMSVTISAPVIMLSTMNSENTLPAGLSLQVNAIGGIAPYTWEVDKPNLASISSTGNVTGQTAGMVVVTATDVNGFSGGFPISILVATLTRLDISPSPATVVAGNSIVFSIIGTYSDNTAIDETANTIWSSSDPSVKFSTAGNAIVTLGAAKLSPITITANLAGITPKQVLLSVNAPVITTRVVSSVKQLNFDWDSVIGADFYRLLFNKNGTSGFTQVGADIVANTISMGVTTHRLDWVNSQFKLLACDGLTSCAESDPLLITDLLIGAVGYVKASDTTADAYFGNHVILSDDGLTLAIAAEGDGGTPGSSNSGFGAVYIYERILLNANLSTFSPWNFATKITPATVESGDLFGRGLSLSGNGAVLAVGAPGDDSDGKGINGIVRPVGSIAVGNPIDNNNASASGAVYIFERDILSGKWPLGKLAAYIKAPNTELGDNFGSVVSLNFNGSIISIGAFWEDSDGKDINGAVQSVGNISAGDTIDNNNADSAGAVYIYERDSTTSTGKWQFGKFSAYIKAPNTEMGDLFGNSIDLSADGSLLVIGAVGEDSNGRDANDYVQPVGTISAGDPNDNNNSATSAGAVYIYKWDSAASTSKWQFGKFVAYIKPPNPNDPSVSNFSNDKFGHSVSLSADGSILAVGAYGEASDGIGGNGIVQPVGTVAFGDPLNNDNKFSSGAVYIYERDTITSIGKWEFGQFSAYIKAPNPDAGDDFGVSISLSGNGNILAIGSHESSDGKDGNNTIRPVSTILAGDTIDNNNASFSGAVYIFERDIANSTGRWQFGQFTAYIKSPNAEREDVFGGSVSLNYDGAVLAVGSTNEDSGIKTITEVQPVNPTFPNNNTLNSGAAYIY